MFFSTETKNPKTLEAHKMKLEFFTEETLTEVCKRLVHHYFQLPVEDLHIWDTEPEDFGMACSDSFFISFPAPKSP